MSDNIKKIRKLESACRKTMGADRYLIRRELTRLKNLILKAHDSTKQAKSLPDLISGLEKKIFDSVNKKKWRRDNCPRPEYNPDLPIVDKKEEIIDAVSKNQVVIISGETGSGKTTQIPKFCLEAGRGIDRRIGCTQPRRIAAMTVSKRIAEELGEDIGQSVGYKIRFQDQTSENSYIKIMTDGILLAETQGDSWLNEYDTLIIDEAHERSLNIDFILGILKKLVHRRRDLKLVITSATIDTEKFSKAFDNAPIIEVSGRMFPVDVRYMTQENKDADQTHVDLAVKAVNKLQQESPYGGDVLVFMPTEQDIRETCEILEGRNYTGANILPLFARLSAGDQSRVFSRMTGRKIIVATNVAETSITIPGIKYVVDTGLARISEYSPGSGTTSLPVVPISKSSADQRMGRCGRVENGICIRLYPQEDYENRPRFTLPEILRSNLAEVILRMISLKLGEIKAFPFIDKPADKNIHDGFRLLEELGAICRKKINQTANNQTANKKTPVPYDLTDMGKMMARLPVDPKISRILLEAANLGCLEEIIIIASALTIQDPRERPSDKQAQADQAHAKYKDKTSDFITLFNIWKNYHEIRRELKTTGKMRKYCKNNYLSFKRMREWRDIHYQIASILEEQGVKNFTEKKQEKKPLKDELFPQRYTAIHQAILSGFLSNIAIKKEKFFYKAAKDKEVMIFPGSGLFNKSGQWIVAAEMVETSRLFARSVANIDPLWLEPIGKAQCRYSHSNPHWERNRGEVTALEQVSLFGLIIVNQRPVSFGPIDPEQASQIFIRSALVQGDVKQSLGFITHNIKLMQEIQDMEDKIRRRDLLVSEDDLFAFYQQRMGNNIYDIRTLKKLIKSRRNDNFLRMRKQDLFRVSPDNEELSLFPDKISLGNTVVPCDYNFDPGTPQDGVTVNISSAIAPSVPAQAADWLVPGLFNEKITFLVKGLPKEFRKQLVPVSNTVDIIADEMPRDTQTPLLTALSRFIYRRFGADIPASAWTPEDLPEHLKMRISIRGPKNEEIIAARDTSILSKGTAPALNPDYFESAKKSWEKTGITEWSFPDLPETITLKGEKGEKWTAYPGLKPQGDSLDLRLFSNRQEALNLHKNGIQLLLTLSLAREARMLKSHMTLPRNMIKTAGYFGGPKIIEKQLYQSILKTYFCKNIRKEKDFKNHAQDTAPHILEKGRQKLKHTVNVMESYHQCRTTLYDLENANRLNKGIVNYLSGLRDSLANLVPENFTELYSGDRMSHLERYIKAITLRAERGLINFEKDQIKAEDVKKHTQRLNELLNSLSSNVTDEKREAVEEFFWLIEEYKVSLYAQELKTPVKVSPKRLEKIFSEIQRMV
ncbi:ATP-dependent RNA helicase HrpA [Desulfobacterales bacterium HSG17]|nr:ATP-dependent RNA helicase HrpA [Desulfobacterales bacterium HSG17]